MGSTGHLRPRCLPGLHERFPCCEARSTVAKLEVNRVVKTAKKDHPAASPLRVFTQVILVVENLSVKHLIRCPCGISISARSFQSAALAVSGRSGSGSPQTDRSFDRVPRWPSGRARRAWACVRGALKNWDRNLATTVSSGLAGCCSEPVPFFWRAGASGWEPCRRSKSCRYIGPIPAG